MKHHHLALAIIPIIGASVLLWGCKKRQNPWIETSNYRIQMGSTWYHIEFQFCPDGIVRWREGKPDDKMNQKP